MKYNSDKYNVRLHTNNVYLQTNKQYSEELLSSFYDSEKHFQIKKKKKISTCRVIWRKGNKILKGQTKLAFHFSTG